MNGSEIILKYFDGLTSTQIHHFHQLGALYNSWNKKINVISRKDIDELYERHVLHALSIAKIVQFHQEALIMDVGTGGGFPGIPLAIMFPKTQFYLIDSIGKKIKVVQAIKESLGLKNVQAEQIRVEEVTAKFDFIIGRSVTQMQKFMPLVRKRVKRKSLHSLPNGILYLKGGDLNEELKSYLPVNVYNVSDFFEEPFFDTKKVVHLPL